MTFLNPVILWGLAAVSIPILIHLFNLKKTKKVEFSTLMFLREIQQTKYKKIKLKQLLILLCRIAFIILLVMMFAKPFDLGFLGSPGNKAKSSVLIILDDSFSMQSRDKNGSDFETAKQKLNETLDALNSGDEIFFTTVSGIDKPRAFIPLKDIAQLRDTIGTLKPVAISRSLNEIIYYSSSILEGAAYSSKEVYFITDGQKQMFESDAVSGLTNNPDKSLHWNVILTGTRQANNLALDTVNTVTKIFEKNRPVKIKAIVKNLNNFNAVNKSIVLAAGNYREEKVLDIPAGSTAEAEFTFKPERTGFTGGTIELVQNDIADDEISGDNRQNFAIYIQEAVNILLISGSPADAEYIKLVLNTSKEITPGTDISTIFRITEAGENGIENNDLSKFSSIVIVNKSRFTGSEAAKLNEYLSAGGGAVIYPGESSDINSYNNELLKLLDLPYIGPRFDSPQPVKFENIDMLHPVFEGIFKPGTGNGNMTVESPDIRTGFSPGSGKNSLTAVKLTNGINFMTEYSKGKGKLIMFAVPPDMNWSDFPKKNLFSPVTIRSILYASNLNGIKPAIAGRDYFIDPEAIGLKQDSIVLIPQTNNPKQIIYPISSKQKGNETESINPNIGIINTGRMLEENLNYEISESGKTVMVIPVNFDKKESDNQRSKPDDIKKLLNDKYSLNSEIIEVNKPLTASISDLRTGRDLWQFFLIGALIFLLIEYLLARSIMRNNQKSGINPK